MLVRRGPFGIMSTVFIRTQQTKSHPTQDFHRPNSLSRRIFYPWHKKRSFCRIQSFQHGQNILYRDIAFFSEGFSEGRRPVCILGFPVRILLDLPLLHRLFLAFGGFVALVLLLGFMALDSVATLNSLLDRFYRHPFTVSMAIRDARAATRAIHLTMIEVIHAPQNKTVARGTIGVEDGRFQDFLRIVEARYLGPPTDVVAIKETARAWQAVRDDVFLHLDPLSSPEQTVQMLQVENHYFQQIFSQIQAVVSFAEQKAATFHRESEQEAAEVSQHLYIAFFVLLALTLAMAWGISHSLSRPIRRLCAVMAELAGGRLDIVIPYRERQAEIGAIARAIAVFQDTSQRMADQHWLKEQLAILSFALQSQPTREAFAQTLMTRLVPLLDGCLGACHTRQGEAFVFAAGYGWPAGSDHTPAAFREGEGLSGQCVRDRVPITLSALPPDYPSIRSALGESRAAALTIIPASGREKVQAIVEIVSPVPLSPLQQALLHHVMPLVGLNLDLFARKEETALLLVETQKQAEELQAASEEMEAQSEEISTANEELRARAASLEQLAQELRVSEEELKEQREELQAVNEEISTKNRALEERQKALLQARAEADRKATEAELASRYKSEFLANMSHELRTPLNSLLILAKTLADNREGNLQSDQVESAQVIHESGSHLLNLINDILDLAKVEAGRMTLRRATVAVQDIGRNLERRFSRLAESRGLALRLALAPELPECLETDPGKLDQILNNLVGNALKFTDQGSVTVTLRLPEGETEQTACEGAAILAIAIQDTGIGIPANQLNRLFRSFEQLDAASDRRHAGTGLGLAISRKLARLLGGEIRVASTLGEGSTFTVLLPATAPESEPETETMTAAAPSAGVLSTPTGPPDPILPGTAPLFSPTPVASSSPLPLFRSGQPGLTPTLLVVEDDPAFARILVDAARRQGFAPLHAPDGASALRLAQEHPPAGIILDLGLPDINGLTLMDRLQALVPSRAVPVHIISGRDITAEKTLRERKETLRGVVGTLIKPVSPAEIESAILRLAAFPHPIAGRKVLLVDGDDVNRQAVRAGLAQLGVESREAVSGAEALARLQNEPFACVITDLALPDMSGENFLAAATRMLAERLPPIAIHASRLPGEDEILRLREYTDCIVLKGEQGQEGGASEQRLLDEVTLFLHALADPHQHGASVSTPLCATANPAAATLAASAPILPPLAESVAVLREHKVLVVDDDMRNAFALSKVLRSHGMTVLLAQDGQRALAQLETNPNIDIVLMDMMMPGMDGCQTIRMIRAQSRFATLPIITVTARAMPADEERSREAGANGYVTKPIALEVLFAAMADCLRSHHGEPAI